MPDRNFYHTIEKPAVAEFRDRGSNFIAHAFPLPSADDFKKKIKALRADHPKAAHHCFAWRIGLDETNFRAGDDGEPSGSAGRPILGQIKSRKLTDTAIVVVRYFGGTLLGVPGLINAYRTASSLALQLTPIIEKPVLVSYQLHFDYTLMNEIMILLKKFGCQVTQHEMQLFCNMTIGIPKDVLEACVLKLQELHGVEATRC